MNISDWFHPERETVDTHYERRIGDLEEELERLRGELVDVTQKWAIAQDLAAERHVLLLLAAEARKEMGG